VLAGIIRFSVRHAGVVLSLAMLLLVYGTYRLSHAGLDIFPEFSAPRVIIQTETIGLTAEQTETLVTHRIERHLAGLIGLDTLRSESIQGLSVITAIFQDGTDIYRNRQLVGERLNALANELPAGIGAPVIVPLSSSSATVLTIGLRSDQRSLMELRDLVDWTLTPRLLAVPGVADVNVFGGEIRQLQIQPDAERLRRHGLSIQEILTAAEQATGMPGAGFIENSNQRIALNVTGMPTTAETLRQVVLIRKQGQQVRLGDVANVTIGSRPSIGAAAIGGKPAIVLMVIGQYGANTLSVSRAVESILRDFDILFQRQAIAFYPQLFRPADYIERSLQNLSGHLLIGGLLVVAVLYLFLFNMRTALIPALAIPLSLLGAVIALLALDIHLNIMVLGGLAIALGEVVDDAIIDTENIFRRLRENRRAAQPLSPFRVVFDASMEVRSSVVFASFIVVLVFLPLLTLGGVAGRLFAPLGYAYMLAIMMSLVVALTVTPALCYLLLAHGKNLQAAKTMNTHRNPPLIRLLQCLYSRVLGAIMRWPKLAVTLSLGICALALLQIPSLGGEFLPELREGHYIVHTASLPGTSLQESMRIGGQLVREFESVPGVVSVSQWAGRAERGADTYGSHYSEYEVRLNPLTGSEQAQVLGRLREILGRYPGLLFEANTFLTERVEETISGYTAPVVINLYGQDLTHLDEKAAEVADMLQSVAGATDIQMRSPPGTPVVQVKLDIESLASVGLRPLEAAGIIQTALQGRVVGHYYLENRAYEVAVILPPEARQQIATLEKLLLKTPDGLIVELGQIARIDQMGGRYNILHRGGQRVQTVTANVVGRDLQSFMEEVRHRMLNELEFPTDISPEFTGAAMEQGAARDALLLHALIAGVGVLLLIYLAIGSLRHVLLILLNLPFSLAGGVAAALLTGGTLSVGSMVGFVTLFGITVRNAIMLVSHYRHLTEAEHRSWNVDTALLGAQQRLPSILMTALVTALALLPIAINSDNPGREIMGPMASVIIGGLISSTTLTLLLLPTVFAKYGRFRSE